MKIDDATLGDATQFILDIAAVFHGMPPAARVDVLKGIGAVCAVFDQADPDRVLRPQATLVSGNRVAISFEAAPQVPTMILDLATGKLVPTATCGLDTDARHVC